MPKLLFACEALPPSSAAQAEPRPRIVTNMITNRWYLKTLAILSLAAIPACATSGVSSYESDPADLVSVENEILLAEPFGVVWDRLVGRLASSFFVINNIERESRLINASFSSQSPEEFVDCGETTRIYERGDEKTEYTYPVAASSSFRMAATAGNLNQFPVTYFVNRSTELDGRLNIYVAPTDADSTRVTVNARYVLTVSVTGEYVVENAFGTPRERGTMTPTDLTASFSTNEPSQTNFGTPAEPDMITCGSRGVLEEQIIDFTRP